MSFTRDWDEARPADTDAANLGDDELRYVRVDVAERLKAMFYGLTAGENTYAAHCKQLTLREQSSVATPDANFGVLYAKDASSVAELHYKDEGGNEKQLTSGGKLNILAADIPADTINETKIQLQNNAYLVAKDAAGTGEVSLIKASTGDKAMIPDGSLTATSAAPTVDSGLANKKYVDDQIVAHGVRLDGTTVFNDHVSTADTWEDLDLSAKVGVNAALVFLEIRNSGGDIMYLKPKGHGGTPPSTTHSANSNVAGVGVFDSLANEYVYTLMMTDASGVIQIACTSNSSTNTIKLIGFIAA